jgi:hypothetical protein
MSTSTTSSGQASALAPHALLCTATLRHAPLHTTMHHHTERCGRLPPPASGLQAHRRRQGAHEDAHRGRGDTDSTTEQGESLRCAAASALQRRSSPYCILPAFTQLVRALAAPLRLRPLSRSLHHPPRTWRATRLPRSRGRAGLPGPPGPRLPPTRPRLPPTRPGRRTASGWLWQSGVVLEPAPHRCIVTHACMAAAGAAAAAAPGQPAPCSCHGCDFPCTQDQAQAGRRSARGGRQEAQAAAAAAAAGPAAAAAAAAGPAAPAAPAPAPAPAPAAGPAPAAEGRCVRAAAGGRHASE